jgi:uncharacterized protein YaaQ
MKFVIAIVQDYDCDRLLRAISDHNLRATRIASTGGFLRTGNTTVLMGVEDDQVRTCIDLIRKNCESRVEVQLDASSPEYVEWFPAGIHEVTVGGAVVFILPVSRMERIMPVSVGVQHTGRFDDA